MPNPALPRKYSLETTITLVELICQADQRAESELMGRYRAVLRRFIHGKLPDFARGMTETEDIVQNSFIKAFEQIRREHFKPERHGSFVAYLRRTAIRLVIDEVRSGKRLPPFSNIDDNLIDPTPDAVRTLVGKDEWERYVRARERLSHRDQDIMILRYEGDCTFPEIARIMNFPSSDAARMALNRATEEIVGILAKDYRREGAA